MRLILLILLSVCYADVIHVPADYSTIQEGIDAAAQDDIVVVFPATYQENIVIDKTITLTSLALFNTETETIIDSLDTWFEWGTSQYDITNDSILTTIIDGSQPVNDSLGSTILIKAADDDCISPKILGFTITGGKGTLIDRAIVNPETQDTTYTPQHLGGGLFSYVTTPDIRYNYFYNNGSLDIEEGGAVYAVSDPDDCPFPTRSRCEIDEIDFSHNFFRDNTSRLGKILANRFFDDEINLSNCVFDYYCEATGNPNMYWVKVDEPDEVDYEETTSDGCPIDWDVWVSPSGSDDGEGSEDQPFQTIGWALSVVVGTEDNPVTINLTEGTFSPSINGESFAINMISNVNLIGQGEEVTILDAEETDRVITMDYCENNIISGLTITGGLADGESPYNRGGGMYLVDSSPTLTNVTISENMADLMGGGMWLHSSNPTLTNVTVTGNTVSTIVTFLIAHGGGMSLLYSSPTLMNVIFNGNSAATGTGNSVLADGGGMSFTSSSPTLTNVTFIGNTATGDGGGMWLGRSSSPTLTDVTFSDNSANNGGGMYLYEGFFGYNNPILTNVTFSGNLVTDDGGGMYLDNAYPILTGVIFNNNSAGDGEGGDYAGGMFLMGASPTLTDVTFSGNTSEYGGGGGMFASSSSNPTLTNVTFIGNSADRGAGILLMTSSPHLIDVAFIGNSAVNNGGGMSLTSSSPTLTNVTFIGNSACCDSPWSSEGGGMSLTSSSPTLTNVTFSGNTSEYGGGMFAASSSSSPTLMNVTFTGNTANGDGGGILLDASTLKMWNSIIWNNTPESIYLYNGNEETIIYYSDIEIGWEGEGNLDTNPLFTDPENGDYTLQENSPCIDAGTAFFVWEGDTLVNMSPDEYYGSAPDMGAYEYEPLAVDEIPIPLDYRFNPAFPNPFNPTTTISFSITHSGLTTITAYTLMGRELETLANEVLNAGYHTINWNASYYPSGVYLIRMESGSFTQTQKVVLVK